MEAFAGAELHELEQDIKSTGFYHNKAKNLIGCAKKLWRNTAERYRKVWKRWYHFPVWGEKRQM